MKFSKTLVDRFFNEDKPDARRLGQRFFDFFKLEKVTSDKDKKWADRVYNAPPQPRSAG